VKARAGTTSLRLATDPVSRGILIDVSAKGTAPSPEGEMVRVGERGREGIFVGTIAEYWLGRRTDGHFPAFAGKEGQATLAALIDGWDQGVLHALATGPATFGQLLAAVPRRARRGLRDTVARMRATDLLVERGDEAGAEVRYGPTDWLRGGVAAILAAVRFELREPIAGRRRATAADAEAALLLALPLARLAPDAGGACVLEATVAAQNGDAAATAAARVEDGRVAAVERGAAEHSDAHIGGPLFDLLDAVIDRRFDLSVTGDDRLARGLVMALNQALYSGDKLRVG
jgi:DNA-binding HxlR family transcriptional regulator